MTEAVMERILREAQADDPACVASLQAFQDPELVGELMVALYRAGTPNARRALTPLLAEPFARGRWQGFKRIYKLAEGGGDTEVWVHLTHVVDQKLFGAWPASQHTCRYLQRRSYRHLKRLAQTDPERFLNSAAGLLRRAQRVTPVLQRLLRLERFGRDHAVDVSFSAALANPFAAVEGAEDDANALLALDARALVADAPAAPPSGAAALLGALRADGELGPDTQAAPPPPWPGPIFSEVWAAEPERLVALLSEVREERLARALARLLREQVGERMGALPLDVFYGLLRHPVDSVWRLGLSQLAARARRELLRFDELIPLFERAASGRPDWDVLADLLFVLDDERAADARAGLGEPLIALARKHVDAVGVGPVIAFLRQHFGERIGPPLFDAAAALDLLGARRPDVRALGRDALERVCAQSSLGVGQVSALLRTPAVEEDAEFVEGLLARPEHRPPGESFTLSEVCVLARELPQVAFALLRRFLLRCEDEGGLDAKVCEALIAERERRVRSLGLELYGGALRRGGRGLLDVVQLLRSRDEDVIVWARERIEEAAGEGRLPNEALYRMLDAALVDVRGFGRELVAKHLRRFEEAELIVFCAESPDAATADMGIRLYKDELAGREGYDLATLLPMFRILLYQVARARPEKERLYGLLRDWALEAPANAQLTVDVVAAFRRSTCRLDLTRALTLLVAVHERYGESVALPFSVAESFGATL